MMMGKKEEEDSNLDIHICKYIGITWPQFFKPISKHFKIS